MSEPSWAQQWVLRRLRFDRATEDAAVDLPGTLDEWVQVLDAAREYGLAGLLASRVPMGLIPDGVRQWLQRSWKGILYANIIKWVSLEEWLDEFRSAGIPVIVLKGAALTRLVYGSLALRPMIDIDFLVERERFEDAGRLLAGKGMRHAVDVDGTEGAFKTQAAFYSTLRNPIYIDVHWHLVDLSYYVRKMPVQWFWNHALDSQEPKPPMRVLSPEAMLLHLSSHLELHHAGSNLLSLFDIAALLHRFGDSLDWDLVLESAIKFDLGQSLQIAVRRAQSVFGLALPKSLNKRMERLPSSFHESLARVLARPEAHPAAFIFDGLDQAGWDRKLRYWRRSLFPADAFMRERHSARGAYHFSPYLRRLGRGLTRIPRALAAGAMIYWQISDAGTDDHLTHGVFP